ncbi:MAG: hypothetical protein P1U88_08075 [Thalassobaculaceae bacterium]|nr:hypothetical protein [Thalassobaculaceae bacterium]
MSAWGNWLWHLAGWLIFVVSALFFVAASWRAEDWLALGGSLAFLVACIVFMVPLLYAFPGRR